MRDVLGGFMDKSLSRFEVMGSGNLSGSGTKTPIKCDGLRVGLKRGVAYDPLPLRTRPR